MEGERVGRARESRRKAGREIKRANRQKMGRKSKTERRRKPGGVNRGKTRKLIGKQNKVPTLLYSAGSKQGESERTRRHRHKQGRETRYVKTKQNKNRHKPEGETINTVKIRNTYGAQRIQRGIDRLTGDNTGKKRNPDNKAKTHMRIQQ